MIQLLSCLKNHKFLITISILLFNSLSIKLTAQVLPPIQNYPASAYNAENQNWSISQSQEKIIYIANNKGLLIYNGANWDLYASPNETIVRSVEVAEDRIYAGYYMEFGFWEKNESNLHTYTSLSEKFKLKHFEDEEFWNIIALQDGVIFQSLDRIYIYNSTDETVRILDTQGKITKTFEANGSVYFQNQNRGLFRIENGTASLISDLIPLKENQIVNIFKDQNKLVILTQENGFYELDGERLQKWDIGADEELLKTKIYSAIRLKNQNFALGSISNGMLYIDKNGKLIHEFNQNNGLQNNTVLSLEEDIDGNIWMGLDNGISYINVNAPFKIFKNTFLGIGSVYAAKIFDGYLYLGTNQGLFYKPTNSNTDFKIIEGTEGQVWSLREINGELFCGHDNGAFIVSGTKADLLFSLQGVWDIKKLNRSDGFVVMGSYDGLYVLEKQKGRWQLKNKVLGFNNSARYFEVLKKQIIVNHEYKGIFHLKVDDPFSKIESITIDTINIGANSGILKFGEDLLYASRKGIYRFNYEESKLEKDSLLSLAYTPEEYTSGRLLANNENDGLWIFTKSGLINITPGKLSLSPTIKNYPLTNEVRSNVIEYENILKYDQDTYLIGTESGYLLLNVKDFSIDDFKVEIDLITSFEHSRTLLNKKRISLNEKGKFRSSENDIEIAFYAAEYHKYLAKKYQYQLEGIYDKWSPWSEKSNVIFKNLPHGNYTFNVRARLGDKISTNVASYQFIIRRAWYSSIPMLLLYGLSFISFLIFLHFRYKRYHHKQSQKLIEKNQRALELTRAKSDKELIKIRNEQLQNDVKNKSKELASSTMNVVRKNELLNQIKDQLSNISDKQAIAPVVELIDKNLNHNDNWKLFKEAFDNVDRKFLENLNKLHPNLSPNDIKLCTYLRLNLSSKEIAPLFKISARSVEIKRYRLRKKLHLTHDKNLVSYILDI